jgi:diacylglycerol kinase (ATP)
LPAQASFEKRALARILSTTYSEGHLLFRPLGSDFTVKRLFSATINSLRGMRFGFSHEAALREEATLLALGIVFGFLIAPTMPWYVAMIGTLLVLLAVEFLNTAIEKLADHVTPEHHTHIGRIKDYGSAAVFAAIALAGIVWIAALLVRLGLM